MTEQTILPNAEQLINDNDLVFYTKEMMKIKIQFNESVWPQIINTEKELSV